MSTTDSNSEKNNNFGSKVGRLFKRQSSTDSSVKDENSNETQNPKSINDSLSKSSQSLTSKIGNLFKGATEINDDLFDELEDTLITSDISIEASIKLVEKLRQHASQNKLKTVDSVLDSLRSSIADMLQPAQQSWPLFHITAPKPYVILTVGVNGVGKTTTTAKIAHRLQQQGKSVVLAAADTFRAAAVEQLQEWGERLSIPVVAQKHGSDAAAVAHDALTSAQARDADVVLIDTAGRLHTQDDLMLQLQKIRRVLQKVDSNSPHEVMQILDAGTGQNAISQVQNFQKIIDVSSYCLTKLDGSAKGGVAIGLTDKFKLPLRFVGTGEQMTDLQPFNAKDFATGLVAHDSGKN